jgi:hypothetical protein
MFHALRPDVNNRSHHDVEDHPSDKLLRVQIRISWKVVFHILEARKNRSEDVLNTQAAGPALLLVPGFTQCDLWLSHQL